jgi:hypothetical protein
VRLIFDEGCMAESAVTNNQRPPGLDLGGRVIFTTFNC